MKRTNLQIINFINFARLYLREHKESTKFRYALERMEKRAGKAFETYSEALTGLQIDHAATEGEGGPLLTDAQGNLRYTKDGIRARNAAAKKLLLTEVEIEPYYATELPKVELTEVEKEVCAGFVIEESEAVAREGDGEQQAQE